MTEMSLCCLSDLVTADSRPNKPLVKNDNVTFWYAARSPSDFVGTNWHHVSQRDNQWQVLSFFLLRSKIIATSLWKTLPCAVSHFHSYCSVNNSYAHKSITKPWLFSSKWVWGKPYWAESAGCGFSLILVEVKPILAGQFEDFISDLAVI